MHTAASPHPSDLALPDTELARSALDFSARHTEPFIVRHAVRGYLYGRKLGEHRGLEPNVDYDDELLFSACVLHDIGLADEANGSQRFEVDGADFAARFLREHGLPDDDVEIVWDAIALHTTDTIPQRKRPEIALCQAGVAVDILGHGRELLPEGFAARVHAAYPRDNLAFALTDAIVAQAVPDPAKANPLSFPGALVRHHLPPGSVPEWHDLIANNGWGDAAPDQGPPGP
ncbi:MULTISPECIES: HD domain-containing protein [Streptomyces]|uniref:HD domain-containing protein n=1 Tax=Streptomyces TaxID=1883 RepID=UPI002249A04E|nr:HD domain-containing protein [Streptomyces sp. JHD 1]MCX2968312.1 HD domain-containing protein [Streptomyces sp. JHD 1]